MSARTAPSDPPGRHRLGRAAPITVVLAWGLTWPVNRAILESLPPIWTIALGSALATVALFAIALTRRRLVVPRRADLPVALLAAIALILGGVALGATAGSAPRSSERQKR